MKIQITRLLSRIEATLGTPSSARVSASPTASSGTLNLIETEQHGFQRTLPIVAAVSPAVVIPATEPQQFLISILNDEYFGNGKEYLGWRAKQKNQLSG